MAAPASPLEELFKRLDGQVKGGQRKKALKTVEEVLKLAPRDEDALRTKAFLLIDLDRFEDALELCSRPELGPRLWYEKAYCLYRLGKLPEALVLLDASERTEAALQLRAQLHYRLEQYDAAIREYGQLFERHAPEGPEAAANVLAAHAAGGQTGDIAAVAARLRVSAADSFEAAFNLACCRLHAGELEQARELLELGIRAGQESLLDEECSEEQVAQELAPLSVQLAHVTALAGRHFQALEQYQELLQGDVGDEGARAVAANNRTLQLLATTPPEAQKAALQEAQRLSDSLFEKGAGLKLKPAVAARLSAAQQQALHTNRLLLLLAAGRTGLVRDLLPHVQRKHPDAPGVLLVRAGLLAREGKAAEAAALLGARAAPGADLQLTRAQLALEAGDAAKAAGVLGELPGELRARPAVVATRAAALEAAGDAQAALALVSAAHAGPPPAGLLPLLSRLQLKTGAVDAALASFKRLTAGGSGAASAAVISQLAAAALQRDPAAAAALERHLARAPEMGADAAEALENAGSTRMAKRAGAAPPGDAPKAKKRARKKAVRLPKGYDPAAPGPPPDPERWLPKWQRSDFKRKRRSRKDKDRVRPGHQGGAVDESLDRTNTETPAAAPNLPKRAARPRGKPGRR